METTGLGAVELSMESPAGTLLPYITSKQEWDSHRAIIENLYRKKDKTLVEVMSIMKRDHQFKASVNMYKKRISQWGLDKKNKEKDILAIVRKTTQRAAVGKKSAFRIRGQIQDPEETERYLKRRGLSMDLVQVQSAATPPGLECFTPSEVPSPPRTPEVFSVPEHIFILMQDYIIGSFEPGTWVFETCTSVKDSADAKSPRSNLINYSRLACDLFDHDSPRVVKACLALRFLALKNFY